MLTYIGCATLKVLRPADEVTGCTGEAAWPSSTQCQTDAGVQVTLTFHRQ